MNWETLYSATRTGNEYRTGTSPDTVRTSFLRDYDRLIFSSAFRRLQNKTQVFPLPGAVFVHNRLTHSLEVASVGRSLGKAAGDILAASYKGMDEYFCEFYKYELPSVIAAACLAHDIGNPPFGHSGEDAIRIYFNELKGDDKYRFENELSVNQQRDFLYFEGNANAFRTLTHSFNEERRGGFQLTLTTLASIVKYPCDSESGFNKRQLFTKKSGFFSTEIKTFENIAASLGIPKISTANVFARHPFVYLVEAADDICYRIIDFEDAHRLNILSFEIISNLFLSFFDDETGYDARENVAVTLQRINDGNQKVQFLRAKLINLLIKKITTVFFNHENELLEGTLQFSLVDLLPEKDLSIIKKIDGYSIANIYNHRSVIEIEMAGYHVIGGLLQQFVSAVMHPNNSRSKKLLQLVPDQFVINMQKNTLYSDVQAVVDFVAGMTDLYAVDLYRKITGVDL